MRGAGRGRKHLCSQHSPLARHSPSRGSRHVHASWSTRQPQGARQGTAQQDPSVERSGRQTVSSKSQISAPCRGSDCISHCTRSPTWPSCQNALNRRRKAADDAERGHACTAGRSPRARHCGKGEKGERTPRHRGQNCTRRRTAGQSWTWVRGEAVGERLRNAGNASTTARQPAASQQR